LTSLSLPRNAVGRSFKIFRFPLSCIARPAIDELSRNRAEWNIRRARPLRRMTMENGNVEAQKQ
jgi:hypothetical protein